MNDENEHKDDSNEMPEDQNDQEDDNHETPSVAETYLAKGAVRLILTRLKRL